MNIPILARCTRSAIGASALRVVAAMLTALAALVLIALGSEVGMAQSTTCSGKTVTVGQDLDAIVNADPQNTATTFCLASGEYPIDNTLLLHQGDKILGPEGRIITRGPASYGNPTAKIANAGSLSRLVQYNGSNTVMKWVEIRGAVGRYVDPQPTTCSNWGDSGKCPMAGTGTAIAAGNGNATSLLEYVEIHSNDAQGISSMNGKVLHSHFYNNTRNPDFLGFTSAAIKGVDEFEAAHNFIHDEQGNGIWCDHSCADMAGMQNGFWAHDNLVVNNGRWGIRYEYSPRFTDGEGQDDRVDHSVTALVEDNEIHGNGGDRGGGASMADAQNGVFRNNDFGAATIAGVSYPENRRGFAIQFSWSTTRSDRTDLYNGRAAGNALNGESLQGCGMTDDDAQPGGVLVKCGNNTP
jgi:hypothetical protein